MSTILHELLAEHKRKVAELENEIAVIYGSEDEALPTVVDEPTFDAEPTVIDWLVGGLIANETVTMLVADPGIGKSTFVSQLTLALANGLPFLGANISRPRRTLTLAAEGSRAAFRARRHATMRALGLQPTKRWTIQHPRVNDFTVGGPHFERMVKESMAELVVLDTIGYFVAGWDENSSEQWKDKLMRPLRKLTATGVSFLLVHHQPKVTESNRGNRLGRGTSAMFADCDHFWLLEGVEGDGNEARRDFVVKKNKYGRGLTSRLRFDDTNALFVEEPR